MPGTPQAIVCRAFGVCGVTVSDWAEVPVPWGKAGMGLGVNLGRASDDHQRPRLHPLTIGTLEPA